MAPGVIKSRYRATFFSYDHYRQVSFHAEEYSRDKALTPRQERAPTQICLAGAIITVVCYCDCLRNRPLSA